jgi:hypothetical protein
MDSELSAIHDDVREIARSMTTFHTETAEKLGTIIESQRNVKERVDKQGRMLLDHEKAISRGKGVIAAIGGLVGLVEGWFHGVSPYLKGK